MKALFRKLMGKSSGDGTVELWLDDLGERPEAVVALLREDPFMPSSGMYDSVDELPELPWRMFGQPNASDTFSLAHVFAARLEEAGATASVRVVPSDGSGNGA